MKTNKKPLSFADIAKEKRYKQTRTGVFLDRAKSIVNFSFTRKLHEELHESHMGRTPYDTSLLFKIILLQKWFGLSDAEAEEQIHDRESFKVFLDINMEDEIPDETTICKFRKILIEKKMDKIFFEEVNSQLDSHNVKISKGSITDATFLESPKGRKNKKTGESTRDKEAAFTKKNNRTYHGFKGHVSTDTKGKYIKKTYVSPANDHDIKHEDKVLTGEEDAIFQDSAYISKEKKKECRKNGVFYGVVERATRGHPLTSSQKKRNKKIASVRCRGEHPFAEMKCRMKHKVRYKGKEKNTWDFNMVTAVYNLKRLIGQFFPAKKQAVTWIT